MHILPFLLILFSLPLYSSTISNAVGLSRQEAAVALDSVVAQWSREVVRQNAIELNSGTLHYDSLQMPFRVRLLGKRPENGYPLYISMHGGGNGPTAMNDQQWANQIMLYTPSCGYYIAPRAPWDDWNMWFRPGIDELFERLISTLVAGKFVDPDRIYIMGYSAGGDGVWRLAPRLADHWAAASMMAGHPGDVSLVNLMHTPFSIWCGALDSAYDRNKQCTLRGQQLDTLQMSGSNNTYIHTTHIVAGKGHWMDQQDTVAVAWMSQYVRNPYPKHIVWRQEEVVRPRFYWLSVPEAEARRGKTIEATIHGNTIDVQTSDYTHFTLWLNDSLVDLDRKVRIRLNGKVVHNAILPRTIENLQRSIHLTNDPRLAFPSCYDKEL